MYEEKLEIVYDIYGFPKYKLSIYNEKGELIIREYSYSFAWVASIAWETSKIELEYIELDNFQKSFEEIK